MEQYLTSTDHIIRGRGNYNSKDGRLQLFEQYFLLMEKWKFVTAIKSTFYWTLKIYAVGPQMKVDLLNVSYAFLFIVCWIALANMYTMEPNPKNRYMQTYWCSLVFF